MTGYRPPCGAIRCACTIGGRRGGSRVGNEIGSDVGDPSTAVRSAVEARGSIAEVTCRPTAYCLAAAEILVEGGVCRDQRAAIAWLCEAGLVSHRTLFYRAADRVAARGLEAKGDEAGRR